MWHFLQTHLLSCFSMSLAYFVHLSCCRCRHYHHHHHCAKKKAVTCGWYTSNMPPPFPHFPYPLSHEHNYRLKHGFTRPVSLGMMTCLIVEWVLIPRFVNPWVDNSGTSAMMKLKKAFGPIFTGEHKHWFNLQRWRRIESVLLGRCFICGDFIISLPHNYIMIAEKVSLIFLPHEYKDPISVR